MSRPGKIYTVVSVRFDEGDNQSTYTAEAMSLSLGDAWRLLDQYRIENVGEFKDIFVTESPLNSLEARPCWDRYRVARPDGLEDSMTHCDYPCATSGCSGRGPSKEFAATHARIARARAIHEAFVAPVAALMDAAPANPALVDAALAGPAPVDAAPALMGLGRFAALKDTAALAASLGADVDEWTREDECSSSGSGYCPPTLCTDFQVAPGSDRHRSCGDGSCYCPECRDGSCPGGIIAISDVVYYVASERFYGEGVRGVFNSIEKAEAYANATGEAQGIDYVVLRMTVDQPQKAEYIK